MGNDRRQDAANDTGENEGLEIHVIGGGRQGPAADGGGLEIGLRIGGETPAVAEVPPEDEVYRLESREQVQARPMSEAGPAVPAGPRARGKRRKGKRPGIGQWTLWMGGLTCVLTVAAVVAAGVISGKKAPPADPDGFALAEEGVKLDAGVKDFLERSGELTADAERLLGRYAAATSVAEVLPLVRDPDRVEATLEDSWQPWGCEPAFSRGAPVQSRIEHEHGRHSIVLTGRRGDFEPFEVAFVEVDGEVKVDWEASEGVGEVRISELRAGARAGGQVVRALVRPGKYFPAEYPEDGFLSYQLSDRAGDHFVWAFVPRGSAPAVELEEVFNENSILLERRTEFRATLRLSGPGPGGGDAFVITEMLHKGWVSP